jgi:glycogen phosphorylase
MTTRDKLQILAENLWWSWNPELVELFASLAPSAFKDSLNNPAAALGAADDDVLNREDVTAAADEWYNRFQEYMNAEPRVADSPRVAYFCMEYGLHESFPIYSGGLGVLAGDHAKAASDLGIPFTAVGLMLRDGYFHQSFDDEGGQKARHAAFNPEDHGLTIVRGEDGAPVIVDVRLGDETMYLQAWRMNLGRTVMYFLDGDIDRNADHLRGLTRRLYQGGRPVRIRQEVVLGIGGLKFLRAIGAETDVYHMNEGHCAFLAFELMRELMDGGMSRADAEEAVREQCVFTTHTPVMAGHDRFEPELFLEVMYPMRDALGLSDYDFLMYGRVHADDRLEWFTMTVLGLNLARKSNGVSRLNGEVAREQWHAMYSDRPVSEVPIDHVTNGIHLPTWTAIPARRFLDKHLGDWLQNRFSTDYWAKVRDLDAADLWQLRSELRKDLVEFVCDRVPGQTLPQACDLDPEALTIGFARRFATYKRAPLLFHDVERISRIFSSTDRPIQIIYAGKAHPADEGGQSFIRYIYEMTKREPFRGRIVFVEDYSMEIGRMLVSGCDVWLNNPRRPMEASGTSGQKIAAHGGLNLSILDGWWPEGYNGKNGWAIDDGKSTYDSEHEQDDVDAASLYRLLEEDVIPDFYNRDERGVPTRWVEHMKDAMATLPYEFSAERMVSDYVEEVYRQTESVEAA